MTESLIDPDEIADVVVEVLDDHPRDTLGMDQLAQGMRVNDVDASVIDLWGALSDDDRIREVGPPTKWKLTETSDPS